MSASFEGIARALGDAEDRIEELQAKHAWQPIETAPKDEAKDVLLYGLHLQRHTGARRCTAIGRWFNDAEGWWVSSTMPFVPTHWMPLPDPPKPPTKETAVAKVKA